MKISDPILEPYFVEFDGVQYTLKEICKTEKEFLNQQYEQGLQTR